MRPRTRKIHTSIKSGKVSRARVRDAVRKLLGQKKDRDYYVPPETYKIITKNGKDEAITCRVCGMTSYHPKDIEYKFCANCDRFHRDMQMKGLV